MRGARANVCVHDNIAGIIPRVCGEHLTSDEGVAFVHGSSPRMRGARIVHHKRRARGRIIPAYAGSTAAAPVRRTSAPDHPRVCGEHLCLPRTLDCALGSSPRMRGALSSVLVGLVHGRIIPAYAGSTGAVLVVALTHGDHPRVCGEHERPRRTRSARMGSSPRMRGALAVYGQRLRYHGIIPAYAVSTSASTSAMSCGGDHPRVCGEHARGHAADQDWTGSSPRMRGAQRKQREGQARLGIIPAYAGSTSPEPSATSCGGDHPLVCGEHSVTSSMTSVNNGSSPRMRGALLCHDGRARTYRIIPAYAGSTTRFDDVQFLSHF